MFNLNIIDVINLLKENIKKIETTFSTIFLAYNKLKLFLMSIFCFIIS